MHIFFFLDHVHFIQPPQVKKKEERSAKFGEVFFSLFRSSWVGHTNACNEVGSAEGEFSRWLVVSPNHCTHGIMHRGAMASGGLSEGHNFTVGAGISRPASRLQGWRRGRGLHSGCTLGSSVSGFPVGYQYLAQQFPSPCWGTVSFGKAK